MNVSIGRSMKLAIKSSMKRAAELNYLMHGGIAYRILSTLTEIQRFIKEKVSMADHPYEIEPK